MNTRRQYKTYTSEFKTEALALISEQGYSVQEATFTLNVTTSLLYSWKKKQINMPIQRLILMSDLSCWPCTKK